MKNALKNALVLRSKYLNVAKGKRIKFSLSFCFSFFIFYSFSQQNLVNNPGFEIYNQLSTCSQDYYICNATNWFMLNNTPDVIHTSNSQNQSASHAPRTGNGNARFAAPPNGMDEYFYGTTLPLTAGQTYIVSFWVRKDYITTSNIPMGLHIGATQPQPQLLNPYIPTLIPQITITPTTTQYNKASFCYTATSSGVHYLTFGSFGGNGTNEGQLWLVDDVSVVALQDGEGTQIASLTIPQNTYCVGDDVVVDGSLSSNEVEHSWEVKRIFNQNEEVSVYSGPLLANEAGQFSVSSVISSPVPGACYRVYLSVYNACKDVTYIDFCYENPVVNFLNNTTPKCENEPLELNVSGDDGWVYTWSTGESGQGLKSIEVYPTSPSSSYTVTVTTPLGCTASKTINFTVHSLANQVPPTMNGINGSGEYTVYINAGQTLSFTSQILNNSGEIVFNEEFDINLPSGFNLNLPPITQNGGLVSFSWQIPFYLSGNYSFTLYLRDNNACEQMENYYTFNIIVICDHCPLCISYDDRSPSTTPVPLETKAGKCIIIAENGPVITGDEHVLFQAGESIVINSALFTSGSGGFTAEIVPGTCVEDCEDCCEDWDGFTYDELPPYFNLNFEDNDPTNDFIQITDTYHPFCAFNAKGYSFVITDSWGNQMNQGVWNFQSSQCCPFESPAPENPIAHSSIWWDGYTQNLFGNTIRPNNGFYFYALKLYGCNGAYLEKSGYVYVGTVPTGMIQNADDVSQLPEQVQLDLVAFTEEQNAYESKIQLSPNPSADLVKVQGIEQENVHYQLYDDKGKMLSHKEKLVNNEFSIKHLSDGMYYVRIYLNHSYVLKKVIKKS